MTGRYSVRSGLSAVIVGGTPNTLQAKEVTLGELFKSRGYATAIAGKWHLGSGEQSWPTRQGFDEYRVGVLETTNGTLYREAMQRTGLPETAIAAAEPYIWEGDAGGALKKVRPYTVDYRRQIEGDIAKAAQNPIADMISLPFQNNTNFDVGPEKKTQNILNIQPVYPVSLGADWNLITRTIVPLISQPGLASRQDRENGLGDIQFSAFFSPKRVVGGWVWGVGAIAQLDTASDERLGQGVWGLGPTAVALHLGKTWVYGARINNIWSVSKDNGRRDVNQMLLQPFVNYNFPQSPGRYLTFSPIITADWEAATAGSSGPCRSGWVSGRSCASANSR